jgi:hypothetical protein
MRDEPVPLGRKSYCSDACWDEGKREIARMHSAARLGPPAKRMCRLYTLEERRELRRIALLRLAEGDRAPAVAASLCVSLNAVHQWAHRAGMSRRRARREEHGRASRR